MTTRDEITMARRKKCARYRVKRLARFAVALGILALLVVLLSALTPTTFRDIGDGLKVTFSLGGGFPAELSDSVPQKVLELKGAFSVLTDDQLVTISYSGKELLRQNHNFASPQASSGDRRLVLFNRGSRELQLYNRTSLIASLEVENAILDAALSGDGDLFALTESERYTAQLEVYEHGGYEKVMTWYCSDGFPYKVLASHGGNTAAVFVADLDSTGLCTQVYLVNAAGFEEMCSFKVQSLAVDGYFDGNRLVLVTDKEFLVYDMDGQQRYEQSFGNYPLISLSARDGEICAVALGDNSRSGANRLMAFSAGSHELLFTLDGLGSIEDVAATGDRVYFLSEGQVYEYNIKGELVDTFASDHDARFIIIDKGIIEILPSAAVKGD